RPINKETAIKAHQYKETDQKNKAIILKEKEKMMDALSTLKFIKKIYPSDTNFLLVQVDDGNSLYEQLVQNEIIVRNQHAVVKNCMRITVGTPEENQKFIQVVKPLDKS